MFVRPWHTLQAICAGMMALTVSMAVAGDWPQWRGPGRDGKSAETGLLESWEKTPPKHLWTIEGMGDGYASPAISKGSLYVTGNIPGGQGVVKVNLKDHKIAWSKVITEGAPKHGYEGSRCTPSIDGDLLYIVTSDGGISCLKTGDGEVVWHSDFSFKDKPTAARMLLAVEIPPAGGHTYFTNCYAAYDTMSDDRKRRIAGKTIKQADIVDTAMKLRPGASLDMDIRNVPGPSHPVISTHPETGRNMIFLGRRHGAYVNGMSLEDSEALLNELWAHTTQQRFVYEHEWQQGDVVVWDNRATLHKRDAFNSDSRRILYAAQVEGHKPYEAQDALKLPPHTRYAVAA